MTRARSRQAVQLDWADRVGFIRRVLPVSECCTQCGSKRFERLDTHQRCDSPLYIPVKCASCAPSDSTWRAHPKKPASSAAAGAAAPLRSLRAKVKRFFVDVLRGRQT